MPTVRELTALYENFLISPRWDAGICRTCFTLTEGFPQCYVCAHRESWLDAVAAISYSVGGEQLHHALASYKRLAGEVAQRLQIELAALLWRYLEGHERCLASATGVGQFDLVTTVPSSSLDRDERHPLRHIVGGLTGATRDRHERLLRRTSIDSGDHHFDRHKYHAIRTLERQTVLLIDDTWTTGASAQSAAAALKAAGAKATAAVVIGRHIKRGWGMNGSRLSTLRRPFDWSTCALCPPAGPASAQPVARSPRAQPSG